MIELYRAEGNVRLLHTSLNARRLLVVRLQLSNSGETTSKNGKYLPLSAPNAARNVKASTRSYHHPSSRCSSCEVCLSLISSSNQTDRSLFLLVLLTPLSFIPGLALCVLSSIRSLTLARTLHQPVSLCYISSSLRESLD